MNQRIGDSAQRAILEWVDFVAAEPAPTEAATAGEAKPAEGAVPEAKAETKPEPKAEEKKKKK